MKISFKNIAFEFYNPKIFQVKILAHLFLQAQKLFVISIYFEVLEIVFEVPSLDKCGVPVSRLS